MSSDLPGDREIRLKLQSRSTDELVAFQQKLKRMPQTPQTWAVRFHLIQVLLMRTLTEGVHE
jgi:hypothetical protein